MEVKRTKEAGRVHQWLKCGHGAAEGQPRPTGPVATGPSPSPAGVQRRVATDSNVTVVRGEATELPAPGIVATGPLTSEALSAAIAARLGAPALAFFDAIAPIVATDSLDHGVLFRASRYGKGGGDDYLNAPLSAAEYGAFVAALRAADQYEPQHEFDRTPYFEGCLPVEEMARRGDDVLRFGPMKPVGLVDPRGRKEPYAVERKSVV